MHVSFLNRLFCVAALSILLAACSRKIRPTTSTSSSAPATTRPAPPAAEPSPAPSAGFPVPGPAPLSVYKAQIIVDGYGKMVASANNLPPEKADKLDEYALKARGFSPEALKNLKARYNAIPPKVIFVPDGAAKEGSKGRYYVLRKKFYYWQKPDGYFHLDEIYYQ